MININFPPVVPAINKDQIKHSSAKESSGAVILANDLAAVLVSTEEHILALRSSLPQTETDEMDVALPGVVTSLAPAVEETAFARGDSASGHIATESNNINDSLVYVTQASTVVMLTNELSSPDQIVELPVLETEEVYDPLTETEIAQTLKLVDELQRNVPLVVEKENQSSFEIVANTVQIKTDSNAITLMIDDPAVAEFESDVVPDPLQLAVLKMSQTTSVDAALTAKEPNFVVPDLIAKVVTNSAISLAISGLELIEKTVILLKNGLAYTNLISPVGELAIPDDLTDADSSWTTWRQDETGAVFLAERGGNSETLLTGEQIDFKRLENQDITGLHSKMNTVTYGATTVTTWSDIRFNSDGTFERASSVLTTTGGAGTLILDTFTSSFHQHTPGSSTNVISGISHLSGDAAVTLGSESAVERPNTHLYGTYQLLDDGLTVEMQYASGAVTRELFYQGGNYIFFGTSSYQSHKTQQSTMHYLNSLKLLSEGLAADKRHVWLALVADSVAKANVRDANATVLAAGPNNRTE